MKKTILFSMFLLLGLLQSCKKDVKDRWIIKDDVANPTVTINDISKDYYNETLELKNFQEKYPWFQGSVSDEDFAVRRKDADEQKIYKEAAAKVDFNYMQNNYFGDANYIKINNKPLLLCFGPISLTTPTEWTNAFADLTTKPTFTSPI